MSATTPDDRVTERLSVLQPGLSFLAARATIELDNLCLGRGGELDAVKELAERLKCATEQVGASVDSRTSLMDPTTVVVFSNAIAASGLCEVRTLADLANEAWEIAGALENSGPNSDGNQIQRMRAFCNHLARSVIAHEKSLHDMQCANANWS